MHIYDFGISCCGPAPRFVLKIIAANSVWQRAGGLLIRPMLLEGEVLWLRPCWSVHTFGMRYSIGVFFLDRNNTVVHVRPYVPPNRIVCFVGARSVCEMLPIRVDHCDGVSAKLERVLSLNTVM